MAATVSTADSVSLLTGVPSLSPERHYAACYSEARTGAEVGEGRDERHVAEVGAEGTQRPGGKPIICLPSTSADGSQSRVRVRLLIPTR